MIHNKQTDQTACYDPSIQLRAHAHNLSLSSDVLLFKVFSRVKCKIFYFISFNKLLE